MPVFTLSALSYGHTRQKKTTTKYKTFAILDDCTYVLLEVTNKTGKTTHEN